MEKKDKTVTEEKSVQKSLPDIIWDNIKDVKLEIFALPNQLVSNYCTPIKIEPTKLYLTTSASAVLPALETALKDRYVVEQLERYLCVSKIPNKIWGTMPFDEEEEQVEQPPKVSLKKVSSQRSIFDSMEKKPTAKDLSNAVKKNRRK